MSSVDRISAETAAEHSVLGRAVVVDSRPQVVRHQGSLPDAVVVDPDDLAITLAPGSPARVPRIGALDTEIAVVAMRAQAQLIAERIAALGYTNVHYVEGGYAAFRSALRTG